MKADSYGYDESGQDIYGNQGTGWVRTGDENGGYKPEEYVDVDIDNGDILPRMEMYDEEYANTFLCKVEYKGDTILPEWLYPKTFLGDSYRKSNCLIFR